MAPSDFFTLPFFTVLVIWMCRDGAGAQFGIGHIILDKALSPPLLYHSSTVDYWFYLATLPQIWALCSSSLPGLRHPHHYLTASWLVFLPQLLSALLWTISTLQHGHHSKGSSDHGPAVLKHANGSLLTRLPMRGPCTVVPAHSSRPFHPQLCTCTLCFSATQNLSLLSGQENAQICPRYS